MDDELCRRALYRTRQQRLDDAYAESDSRGMKAESPRHFAVCQYHENEITNKFIEENLRIIDVAPVWVKDFDSTELPERLSKLRKVLKR